MCSRFIAKLPDSVKHYPKLIFKKRYTQSHKELRRRNKEFKRLKRLPRYQPAKSSVFGKEIELVYAHTFFSGFKEILERGSYEFKSSSDTPYVIDCGANIGLSLIYSGGMFRNAAIVAYEPDPAIYACLKNNMQSFGFGNVKLHEAAVWDENTEVDFQVEGAYSGRIPMPGDVGNIIKVQAKRLRDFLDRKVDFLKIDIEGAECLVIQDCRDSLNNVMNIFIEYHSREKEPQKLHELLRILYDSGFRYHIHEAWTSPQLLVQHRTLLGMDLQLNIFGFRS